MSRNPYTFFKDFLQRESSAGLLLMAVAALALLIANSPLAETYFAVQHHKLAGMSVLHWINDALMALFFLLVGLELKREMLQGQLSSWAERALPGIAALGGMVVPALIYVAFSDGDAQVLRGWAIPMATDIAFALGVLALLGSRVPVSLKVFLTALAIIDDLGAVIVIALFYTNELSGSFLGLAALTLVVLAALNRFGVRTLPVYLLLGALLWWFVLKSGIHATLAGVALALTIPLRSTGDEPEAAHSPLITLEHALHPWIAFLIIPLFGFANAGVSFAGMSLSSLADPVPLGIAVGLVVGKQVGVFGFSLLAIQCGLARLPLKASWLQLYGVSALCGIGFTMSLFIGALAFASLPALADQTKIGVLLGSVISAAIGAMLLVIAARRQPAAQ